ncbi:ankyrin, partial [Annulohypoxylon truncatum]|uniref:ankyrin n=1 Tax=Annulohypoxylon truncatum TaxID=327061 RepID=UPI0020080694
SAYNIKQFLDTIHNAPTEIIRLRGVISQLQLIAESIKAVLERQKQSQCRNSHICNNIYHELKTCQSKLNLIEDVLQIAKKVENGQNTLSRSWAQFRLACRKEKIEEFEKQLERAISFLNVNLLLNLIDSNTTLGLEFGSFAQELSTRQEHSPIKNCRPYSSRDQGTVDTQLVTPLVPSLSRASVHRTWSNDNLFQIQCYKTRGKHKKHSVLLRVRISRSYMIIMQLSGPLFGVEYSVPFNISIRNIIPANAAILRACKMGDSEQLRLLFKKGSARPNDMTPDNHTLLGVAIKEGHEEVVQFLLREGADPNLPYGNFQVSPLQLGIHFEKPSIVCILIRQGADPYYSATQKWSLLHYLFGPGKSMASAKYFPILRDCLLFDDIKDKEGWTALHRCAAFGTGEDVRFLHLLGASAYSNRYTTRRGWSPIHVAALMNNVSTLEALSNLQTDRLPTRMLPEEDAGGLDAVDIYGWTPLHLATHRGSSDTMEWLLRNGADPHRTTYGTADWFPEGREGEALQVADLVMLSKENCLELFLKTLRDIGYDITIDGDDIYWPPHYA